MGKDELFFQWENEGISREIIDAIKSVPRELFIQKEYLNEAYGDYPLPTFQGQTISQPTTVALMLQYLELEKGMKVLEIGAGSGWNAAIIGRIVGEKGRVFTTEIIEELAGFAARNIAKLKMKNAFVVKADGSKGYAQEAPYDRIIVTAAAPKILSLWKAQLKESGIIVAPVGGTIGQAMIKARKIEGELSEQNMGYFQFVPLKTEK